jgi:hypothetical protein
MSSNPSPSGSIELRQIELIAIVVFRVTALSFAMTAILFSCHLVQHLHKNGESPYFDKYQSDMFNMYLIDVVFHASVAVVFFLFSRPLAKMICKGLSTLQSQNVP